MKCPGQDMQFWKPGDIYEVDCPGCGRTVEFFKDDTARRCGQPPGTWSSRGDRAGRPGGDRAVQPTAVHMADPGSTRHTAGGGARFSRGSGEPPFSGTGPQGPRRRGHGIPRPPTGHPRRARRLSRPTHDARGRSRGRRRRGERGSRDRRHPAIGRAGSASRP